MTGPEQGFLLLTSTLGDPDRRPLTVAQLRTLAKRVVEADKEIAFRDLETVDIVKLGYDTQMAQRIIGLLSGTNQLRAYLRRAEACACYSVTRLSPAYPISVRQRLGLDSPGVLWAKGDVTLMRQPAVAVVGSRDLNAENRVFAEEAGRKIAQQGFVLVSGNARGADKCAQEAALEAGGSVISIVADSLQKQPLRERILYLSLDDFDQGFSARRALQRNHVIHSLAALTVVCQCTLGRGGTWDGTLANLKNGWNPVCIYADGSDAAVELQNRGAHGVGITDLQDLPALMQHRTNFIDP